MKNVAMAELLFRRRQLIAGVHADNPNQPFWECWERDLGLEERNGGAVAACAWVALRGRFAHEVPGWFGR